MAIPRTISSSSCDSVAAIFSVLLLLLALVAGVRSLTRAAAAAAREDHLSQISTIQIAPTSHLPPPSIAPSSPPPLSRSHAPPHPNLSLSRGTQRHHNRRRPRLSPLRHRRIRHLAATDPHATAVAATLDCRCSAVVASVISPPPIPAPPPSPPPSTAAAPPLSHPSSPRHRSPPPAHPQSIPITVVTSVALNRSPSPSSSRIHVAADAFRTELFLAAIDPRRWLARSPSPPSRRRLALASVSPQAK
uniref:Uncharacterized protein n=1 Tax=Oryza meridionalis TaxID=40149 RepID=A0A0E0DUC4_9ORYZ